MKVRSKSRFSTATKTGDLETTLSQSASNLKFKIDQKEMAKMTHKTRFSQPSSAISLPTLAFSASECKENISSKKLAKTKSEAKNKLKENVKVVKKPEKNKTEEFNGNKKKNNGEKARKNCNRLFNEKNLNETVQKIFYTQIERAENKKNLNLGSKLLNQTPRTIAIDQESIDEDENNFDEEIKKNKEREEMLQKEISELEAADIEVSDLVKSFSELEVKYWEFNFYGR